MLMIMDPGIQVIPTLGPKIGQYYIHWAIRIPRDMTMDPADPKLAFFQVRFSIPLVTQIIIVVIILVIIVVMTMILFLLFISSAACRIPGHIRAKVWCIPGIQLAQCR